MTTLFERGRAEACANIALAKYWGKSARGDNLTAVPSLSLTLDALRTRTEVRFVDGLGEDEVTMGNEHLTGEAKRRVSALLNRMRALSGQPKHAQVNSVNNFPTAAGLASSASGFAALSVAAAQACGLSLSIGQLSSQARKSSASAARSLFEGWSELQADADEARGLFGRHHWDVAMVVAVVGSGRKPIGSTGGMEHTKRTSPYFPAWERAAPELFQEVKAAIKERDFERVARSMEASTRLMHATMFTAEPPVLYLKGPTVDLMHEVAAQRARGLPVAYTMDAGPNVKVLTLAPDVKKVERLLASHVGVERTIVCRPGPAASLLSLEGDLDSAMRADDIAFPIGAPSP